jgi:hypothetical protein
VGRSAVPDFELSGDLGGADHSRAGDLPDHLKRGAAGVD